MFALISQTLFKLKIKKTLKDRIEKLVPLIQNAYYSQHPCKYSSNIAYFQWQQDKNIVNITLNYIDETTRIKKLFNFQRQADESIDISLNKIKLKIVKYLGQKLAVRVKADKNKGSAESFAITNQLEETINQLEVQLLNENDQELRDIDWLNIFQENPNTIYRSKLKVGDENYKLAINYPCVNGAKLPSCIMVGYECYPSNLEFRFTSKDECEFTWYRGVKKSKASNNIQGIKWEPCGSSLYYYVQPQDVDHWLKV